MMSQLQRQMLLSAYLLAHRGPVPSVIQLGKVTQFTRWYLYLLSQGHRFVEEEDARSIDQILTLWDKREAR